MGQKINPIGFRLGPLYTWTSRWYADKKNYRQFLLEDVKIRKILMTKLRPAGITRVEIERSINTMEIIIYVARPGLVIGRGGTGMDDLKKYLLKTLSFNQTKKNTPKIDIKVEPVKEPNLDAYLVATNIAEQLTKRFPAKRAMNQALDKVLQAGAKGVRIILSGRIGGAEIARREKVQSGVVPLSTLREKIDFAKVPALTKSGYVGIKVWICKK
ncbi:30S ribosomal protein S3 [Candidatus Gottesmanbacteria bacterium]|nr:30S ribosomal protein S3 [Candidatus Gottesmanbacteria bacterium]